VRLKAGAITAVFLPVSLLISVGSLLPLFVTGRKRSRQQRSLDGYYADPETEIKGYWQPPGVWNAPLARYDNLLVSYFRTDRAAWASLIDRNLKTPWGFLRCEMSR
jgi:hypothetical protein